MEVVYSGQGDQAAIDMTSMEREFIRKYEQMPLLWHREHPDYSNKFKRNLAYDILLPVLRKFIPSASRYNVRQKINILRSTYRKELRKYLASKTLTTDGEIVYTHIPPSWKFEAMKFLQDLNESKTEIPQSEIIIEEHIEDDTFNELEEQELVFIQEQETESGNEDQEIPRNPILASPILQEQKKHTGIKNSRKRNKFNEAYIIDRECSAVGSNVSCKLQRMNNEQRPFAEQLINKVLMRGLRRTLLEETDFTDSTYIVHKTEEES